MELLARIRPLSRRAAFLSALVALFASAFAVAVAPSAQAAKKKKKAPTISKVAPLDVAIGETLTLRGRNFISGRKKNTVVFKRAGGGRAVFAKGSLSTKKMLRVTVPESLAKHFRLKDGNPVPTRFRLRVLAKKFGKKFTSVKRSPMVSGPRPASAPAPADGDCDADGTKNGVDADDDNDLLADITEKAIGTDPCKLDNDGDGVEDGYEYRSARDFNDDDYQSPNSYLPYPYKTPYPNPLFPDATLDYDGDSLTLGDEQALWRYTTARWAPRSLDALTYSDGEKYTRNITAVSYQQPPADGSEAQQSLHKQYMFLQSAAAGGYPGETILNMNGRRVTGEPDYAGTAYASDTLVSDLERYYFDEDHNGKLRDDELDEDGDGISNYDEAHGYMQPSWWRAWYGAEGAFAIAFAGTKLDDPDSDGDGIVDGADDQDRDDIPNVHELSRRMVAGEDATQPRWAVGQPGGTIEWNRHFEDPAQPPSPANPHPLRAMVDPFNPCLPDINSRSCPERIPANAWAPFNLDDEQIFWVFN